MAAVVLPWAVMLRTLCIVRGARCGIEHEHEHEHEHEQLVVPSLTRRVACLIDRPDPGPSILETGELENWSNAGWGGVVYEEEGNGKII